VSRFPDEVVITDAADADGTSTPAGEPDDDFFSSWDKPSIKRPTPPVSRTATPPVVGRTPSPFLNAGNGNGINRAPSPLAKTESKADEDAGAAKPAASRVTTSAALRSKTTGAGARKTNVLGAKKNTKLGAKKVTADLIDFDEAEKKAKEEADRIAKLGYDPEAEEAEAKKTTTKNDTSSIASPTPVSPAGYGHTRQKSAAEVERLGLGMGRLGFGQIGGAKPAAAPAAKKNAGGFGSVGPVKAAVEGMSIILFLIHRHCQSDPHLQTTASALREKSLALRRASPRTSSSAGAPLTPIRRPRPRAVYRASRAPRPSRPTPTLVDLRMRMPARTMATWRLPPRTLFASSASLPATILRT
jgi:hypothetical protein